MQNMTDVVSPAICVKGGGGLLLPIGGDSEQEWPRVLRAILYLIGLLWCFMGVSIIADVFMSAIEKVTSKKVRLWDKKKQKFYTFEVWNATVANLTLMALGSSAPEILLNVIDIFAKEFFLEGLGPSTIVGSAAFNLLMIIAVCIVSLPAGQVRYIKDTTVYICTATWSIFAYIWLIIILLLSSPHVVEVWEGVLTFLFFPMLAFNAFAADKGWIGSGGGSNNSGFHVHEDMTNDELAEVHAELRKTHGANLTNDQAARILLAMDYKPRSRAHYRIKATRAMFGGKRLNFTNQVSRSLTSMIGKRTRVVPCEEALPPVCTFEVSMRKLAVLESNGPAVVKIIRRGEAGIAASVGYETEDGTAEATDDYEAQEGRLEFAPGETEKEVQIPIVDDDKHEADECFYLKLKDPQADGERPAAISDQLGRVQITIIDDDDAGMVSFGCEGDILNIKSRTEDFKARIPVQRRNGACGEVRVSYHTEADTAIAGKDFESAEGVVVFDHQQVEGSFEVAIKGKPCPSGTDRFRVFLTDPENGATLDASRDGGATRNILTVAIEPDTEAKESVDRIRSVMAKKWEKSKIGHANWATQFKEAIYVNGGADDDGDEESQPSAFDYVTHIVTLPWKLLFALVPPTDFCGGWVCFFCALLAIGFVTMIINDIASLLGCVLCISDDITAITFVALGTSLPDTFASMVAARSEPYADSSVGNVTGSNSVNVFLGLGLPWMIASIAWSVGGSGNAKWQAQYQFDPDLTWLGPAGSREQAFVVKAGSLAFSVTVYTICAVCAVMLLALRRKFCGGELGGPKPSSYGSSAALVALWFLYIALSCWKSVEEGGGGCAK